MRLESPKQAISDSQKKWIAWRWPGVGLGDGLWESPERRPLEHGRQETPEVGAHPAEAQAEVHALPEHRV